MKQFPPATTGYLPKRPRVLTVPMDRALLSVPGSHLQSNNTRGTCDIDHSL
ncbi:hypothetical protein BSY16_5650 (plasmid) [Sinorhizobium sp. RAC02]|nr:hypothetical protein BSY16_5650 [Sinorhizobium sp. RAC02]